MRRFVLIGQTASASSEFSLEDLPSTSGRLDVLLRCIRAALLVSHGLRPQVEVHLLLRGGGLGSRLLRVDSARAKFVRPDERSLATLIRKTLAAGDSVGRDEVELRPGLFLRQGELEDLLHDSAGSPCFVLHEEGKDVRELGSLPRDAWFFLGDHVGFDVVSLALLERHGCTRIAVGPLSLHSDDVVTLLHNELDRRGV